MIDLSKITYKEELNNINVECNNLMYRQIKTMTSIINAVNPKLEEKVYNCSSNDIEPVKNFNSLQDLDKFDVVFFTYFFGKSAYFLENQKNVLIKSDNTSYILLQHAIKMLKNGGRCAFMIEASFLDNDNDESIALRKHLLKECKINAILEFPWNHIEGKGPKIILFFTKRATTVDVWHYQLCYYNNNNLEKGLSCFVAALAEKKETENFWSVKYENICKTTWDLTSQNSFYE
jgi:type I restriction enzyme M protein